MLEITKEILSQSNNWINSNGEKPELFTCLSIHNVSSELKSDKWTFKDENLRKQAYDYLEDHRNYGAIILFF